jgi:hypothetical protein
MVLRGLPHALRRARFSRVHFHEFEQIFLQFIQQRHHMRLALLLFQWNAVLLIFE